MDDRSCFVILLRTAELLRERELDVDFLCMGSTREEISGSGAQCATFGLEPDFCVAVDVTHGRTPDGPQEKSFEVGGGPVVGVRPNMTRWMTERAVRIAGEQKYSLSAGGHVRPQRHQRLVYRICREGIPTLVVSLPLKYMHSPIEVLDEEDVEQAAQLLAAFSENLGKEAEHPC